MIYEIQGEKEIKLFNSNFLNNNRKKFKLIVENKLFPLIDKYKVEKDKTKFLNVKLLLFNKERLDLSNMFDGCTYLKKFDATTDRGFKLKTKTLNKNLKNENNEFYHIKRKFNSIIKKDKYFEDIVKSTKECILFLHYHQNLIPVNLKTFLYLIYVVCLNVVLHWYLYQDYQNGIF